MARHHFPGFPAFLEVAARQIGHPEAERPARRIEALAAVANLCAQAAVAEGPHVAGILAKAAEIRDQLHAAHRAADLMLADLRSARAAGSPETVTAAAAEQGRRNTPAGPGRRAVAGATPASS